MTAVVENNALGGPNNGIIPFFTGQAAKLASSYVGNEIFAGLTWRFAPGLALDSAGGYMWTGPALDAYTNPTQGSREARNVYIPDVPHSLRLLSGSGLGGIDHVNPKAAPIEAAIAREQRIGLLGRVSTDQEIGDETVAGSTGGPPAFPP